MPTIKQLPAATSVAATDLLPLSQAGTTKALAVGSLLSSVQPALSVLPGQLLGRVSGTAGGPEVVGVGTGLSLSAGSMVATGGDHPRLPVSTGLASGDEVIVNTGGQPKRMVATALRGLFSGGAGVSIDGSGVISATGGAGFSGVSSFNARSGPITLSGPDLVAAGGVLASAAAATYATRASPALSGVASVDGAAGAVRGLALTTGGVLRWQVVADGAVEGGGQAGSNLAVFSYADNGAYLANPLSINRASGVVTLNGGLIADGPSVFNGDVEMAQPVHVPASGVLSLGYKTASRWGGAACWVEAAIGGALAYQTLAAVVSYPTTGVGAVSGAARASDVDAARAGGSYTGFAGGVYLGYVLADATATSQVWGQYLLAHKQSTSRQNLVAVETDVANEAPLVPISAYNIAPTGVTAGHWLANGGEVAQTGTTVNPASAAIGILSDAPGMAGARWNMGLVFDVNGLATANQHGSGNQVAAQMAQHHELQWAFDTSGTRGLFVRSDATAAGMGVVGVNGALNVVTEGEAVVASIGAAGISENGTLLAAKYAPLGFVRGAYTASGAIAPGNTLAILNGASGTLAMTLAAGVADGQALLIKLLGAANATVTANIDGSAGAVVTMTASGAGTIRDSLALRWSAVDATWLAV